VLAATPKGKANALNANAIAKTMSDARGKTVWPMPSKAHLEKATANGDARKATKDGQTLYYV
jgi:hypothetical protein